MHRDSIDKFVSIIKEEMPFKNLGIHITSQCCRLLSSAETISRVDLFDRQLGLLCRLSALFVALARLKYGKI